MKNILLIIVCFIGGMIFAIMNKSGDISTNKTESKTYSSDISDHTEKVVSATENKIEIESKPMWYTEPAKKMGLEYKGSELFEQISKYAQSSLHPIMVDPSEHETIISVQNSYDIIFKTNINESKLYIEKKNGTEMDHAIMVAEMMRENGYVCDIIYQINNVFVSFKDSDGMLYYSNQDMNLSFLTNSAKSIYLQYNQKTGEYTYTASFEEVSNFSKN
jgi:hypothetical protein